MGFGSQRICVEAKSGNVMIDRPIVDKIDEEILAELPIKRIWTVADVEN
ncbi:MAG TPA: hypothetical protein PK263_03165 [bacterium]|nr:hypothetical protein [bacterium]